MTSSTISIQKTAVISVAWALGAAAEALTQQESNIISTAAE